MGVLLDEVGPVEVLRYVGMSLGDLIDRVDKGAILQWKAKIDAVAADVEKALK